MPNLELILPYALPLVLSYASYLFGKRKSNAETDKIKIESENLKIQAKKLELEIEQQEVDTEKDEIDVMNRTVDFYKNKMSEMLDEIEGLKRQVSELKAILEGLALSQCLGNTCPTKIEYNKIMAKRAARKKPTPRKKEL